MFTLTTTVEKRNVKSLNPIVMKDMKGKDVSRIKPSTQSSSQPKTKEIHRSRRGLVNSQSIGTLEDRIRQERRAHTMAPLTRISGPSVPPQSKLFASLIAPSDTRILSKTPVKHRVEQIDDDEDTPIFVKVRYNPEVGGMPSEEAVRRAIDQQLQQSNRRRREEPIIVNFLEQTKIPQVQRHFPPVRSFQQFRTVPHLPPQPVIYRPAYTALPNHHQGSSNTLLTNKGFNHFKTIRSTMTTQGSRPHTAPTSSEMFRPTAISDVPELSKDNLLNMLNQIPDLKGRQFKIEYASSDAPEAYPIPFHLDSATSNNYPEPVVVDQLPNNIIQHVKTSNNPALAAALDAAIQQEHHHHHHPNSRSTLNPTASNTMHHAVQSHGQVQESRPVSSDDSDSSSTEVSSSSEESETEESESTPSARV